MCIEKVSKRRNQITEAKQWTCFSFNASFIAIYVSIYSQYNEQALI